VLTGIVEALLHNKGRIDALARNATEGVPIKYRAAWVITPGVPIPATLMPMPETNKYWVLVAEDDPIIRRLLVTLLEPEGHHLLEAHDGLHALKIFQAHADKIDLLITDINMPEITGFELARNIKEARPDIRIIVISGQKEETFPPEAGNYAAALLKPIDPKRLINKVRELLPA
jgi:CheY-like chemotaxis protein